MSRQEDRKFSQKYLVLMMGPPGVGKGSLSALCEKELGWEFVSTGNLCRWHVAEKTPIGEKIDFAIRSGKLISDGLVTDMVAEWLSGKNVQDQADAVFVVDGYPRTEEQARMFYDMLKSDLAAFTVKIIRLTADPSVLVDRIANRLVCSNSGCQAVFSARGPWTAEQCKKCGSALHCRADDIASTVRHRITTYYEHEEPLLNFYRSVGLVVHEVDASVELPQVFEAVHLLIKGS